MKIVRMLTSAAGNAANEVCGHRDDIAAALVKRGHAVYVTAVPETVVTKGEAAQLPLPPAVPPAVLEPTPHAEPVSAPEVSDGKKRYRR